MKNKNQNFLKLQKSIQDIFGIVDTEELQQISALFAWEYVPKNTKILMQDKSCYKMYFLLSGYLRIYAETAEKQVTQWIANENYFVTDLSSFIFDTSNRWNFETITDVEVYSITKEDYKKIRDLIPKWLEIERLFIIKCFTTLEDRIFSHLSMTAEERYLHYFNINKEIFKHVPLQYLASMLGMTPETFSRIRKKQHL